MSDVVNAGHVNGKVEYVEERAAALVGLAEDCSPDGIHTVHALLAVAAAIEHQTNWLQELVEYVKDIAEKGLPQ